MQGWVNCTPRGYNSRMSAPLELLVGRDKWRLTVSDAKRVRLTRAVEPAASDRSPRELVRAALESPLGLGAPVRRAVTPDDHVCIVLDEQLPHVAELLTGVLEHLTAGGIDPAAVTVLLPPGEHASPWIDALPDEFADLTVETHDPESKPHRSYLATTKAGRRVYLNRSLADADFVLTLTGRRFDPATGHAGAEAGIFPTFSDGETLAGFVGKFTTDAPSDATPTRAEATEVVWLLGMPVFVQVVEGPGESIAEIVAGPPASTTDGVKRYDARWRTRVDERPDLVIAAVSGDPAQTSFADLAWAASAAARVVRPGGRVAVLSSAAPKLEEGAELLRQADDAGRMEKVLHKRKPDDWPAAALWAMAAEGGGHLFVAAGWPDDVTEELFATPVRSPAEVQRLIDASDRVLVVPDAQKTLIEVA